MFVSSAEKSATQRILIGTSGRYARSASPSQHQKTCSHYSITSHKMSKYDKRVKCPVCKADYWAHTVGQHIVKTAEREALRAITNMVNASRGKEYTFSPRVVLRNSPHWAHYRKNKPQIRHKITL